MLFVFNSPAHNELLLIRTKNSVSVLSKGNWHYNFDISRSSDGNYEIIFTDKAMNGGSYHSVTTFDVKLENGILLLEETNSKLF